MGVLIVLPLFPNVPNVPGVPSVPRSGQAVVGDIVLLTADAKIAMQQGQSPKWGIFLNGVNALNPDSIVGFEYKDESKVASFPIENGGFASYDKVDVPWDIRVEMTKGGTLASRSQFLKTLKAAKQSLNLYTVVTPEISIPSGNITHFDYRRTEKSGVTLMTFSVWLQEIRTAGTPAFTSTASPNGASPQNGGTVQPTAPTPSQSSAITNAGPPQPQPPNASGGVLV